MRLRDIKKFKILTIAFLASALLSVGVLSIPLMHNDGCMEPSCTISVCQSADCAVPSGDFSCLNHCVSAILNAAQSAPVNSDANYSLLLLAAVICSVLFGLSSLEPKNNRLSKLYLRQFYEQSKSAFFKQLGFWLGLFEKRDPSCVFILT